jgi:hypothetical protein
MAAQKKADHATAVPKAGMTTPAKKIQGARDQIAAFNKSPGLGSASQAVKDAAAAWGTATDAYDTNTRAIPPAVQAATVLRNNQPVLARRWAAKKRAFFAAVNDYADGSADTITALSCEVQGHAALPPAGVPLNVHDAKSKVSGTAEAVWKRNKHEFLVQTCTNPADPTTFAEPVCVSKARYKLANQTPGATIHLRVLTLDPKLPNGKSAYTPWIPVVVGV